MSLLDGLRATRDEETTGYEAVPVDDELVDLLAGDADRPAVTVRPHKDNGGIEAMDEVLEALHTVEKESPRLSRETRNVSPAHTFEMRYARPDPSTERVVTLQYVPGSDATAGTFRRQLQNQYPDSQVEETEATLLPGAADAATDDRERYVAGATLDLRRYSLYPIKNVDLPGFRSDPTGSVLEEMVGTQEDDAADADVVVQIQFKPAARDWTQGIDGGPSIKTLSYNLTQPSYEKHRLPLGRIPLLGVVTGRIPGLGYEKIEHDPSKVDRQAAKLLEQQQGEKGWRLSLRVLAVSDDPDVAISRASKTAGMFRNFYESNTEQTFAPTPLDADTVPDVVERAGRRQFGSDEKHKITKSQREVAGLVNVPEAEHVSTNKLRWSLARPGEGIPPGTPRFDFAAHDVDGATDEEQQLAMLGVSDVSEPYWYGWGARHGVEAGVDPDVLRTHQFIGGSTGQGKTTFLVNFVSQVMNRGHGGLVIDPKGKDADEFVREWPEDRDEEDFVFVDHSDEFDKQVRFNFLDVPGDAEEGSRAFSTAVEALADDLVAMVAQAGGDENYWGARMDRVLRTLIRGMARSGRTCTLLDLACCLTDEGNRDRFAEWMSEERIHFIARTAEQISDMDSDALEPLAGRLEQWLQNDAIRDLISARESTVSLRDAVEEGKVIVVRNAPQSGDTEKRLFATALIRRAWVAVRETDDAPPFHVVCDEFDSIVTTESNIHRILSEARAFDFPLTLACQNPDNQLPDTVATAIANQCRTFVSFNPGGEADARLIAGQHSPDVEWEDLTNMSPYKFYMRTLDENDELTHSYKVEAFPPVDEVRQGIEGAGRMTDDELDALKRRSVERYGATSPTPEEQKARSHFYGDGQAEDAGDIDVTDAVERAVAQGVYDTACRAGDPEGFVPLGDARATIVRRLAALSETPSGIDDLLATDGDLWRRVVQHVPDDRLDVRDRDGEPEVRATNPRATIATVGDDQSAGGASHGLLLWDAYPPLTWAGLDVTIQDASGDDADALAEPAPDDEQNVPALVDRLTGGDVARLESESSTGRTKGGVTAQHVMQAANEGRRAIVLTRPADAQNIADTLHADPEYCRTDHPVPGETRLYTSPRDVRINGEQMTRPGARSNAWVRDEETDEIILRDGDGTEHARFEDANAVFSDRDPYPSDGERPVKQPILPAALLEDDADPHAEIVTVPEDADALTDLSLAVDVGMTVPGAAIGERDGTPDADELDVSDRAARFYEVLCAEANGSVTVSDAHDLAGEQDDPDLDVSRRAVRMWLGDLADEDALDKEAGDGTAAATYHLR